MSRRGLLWTIAPSMVVGGLLFGGAFGDAVSRADDGRDRERWSNVVAQADPWQAPRVPAPPAPAAAPAAPAAPVAPVAPVAPRNHNRHGVSVQWRDGKLELDGIEELVQDQLERVNDVLDNLPDLSPEQRNKVRERVRRVRDKLRSRLRNIRSMDVSKVEAEMERMGDEIEREMEGVDRELSQFGEELGQRFAKKLSKDIARSVHAPDNSDGNDSNDSNDDNDSNDAEDAHAVVSGDVPDMSQAIASLRNIALDKEQKQQLARLRADADRQIASAQRDLDRMSERLQSDLGRARVDEAEVSRQIDEISAKEAQIRKARILTWVKVRGLLHDDQRRQVEAAAKRR